MTTTRMTGSMRRWLESRLVDLDARIETLDAQRKGDDSMEATALLMRLTRERDGIADALQDVTLIEDEPFDTEAIEIGDRVTIRDADGEVNHYVLVDGRVRSRPRSDWVSVSSPLGAALLGRSKGEKVLVESPAGPMSYIVVDFERASGESLALDTSADARRVLTLLASRPHRNGIR